MYCSIILAFLYNVLLYWQFACSVGLATLNSKLKPINKEIQKPMQSPESLILA